MASAIRLEGTAVPRPTWRHAYLTMTGWDLAGLRLELPLIVVVQILSGIGFVLGIGLFFQRIPAQVALYVSTGVVVLNLILVGLIVGPQNTADQKLAGTYEYLRALPVPATAAAGAWFTVALIASLPAAVVSLVIAELRYGISFTITPSIVPAVLLTAFTGTMLGYALSHAIDDPMRTRLIAQMLVFFVFGFSPILYPASQQPPWLATISWWLPFEHMATIVRAGLTTGVVSGIGRSYLIVAIWGIVGTALSARAVGRRA
ncbi:MAG TPA: ABC transporter permease [Actinomycetota bacterium]|nr:ABC transporter permease [Actinomycetota bacterium]